MKKSEAMECLLAFTLGTLVFTMYLDADHTITKSLWVLFLVSLVSKSFLSYLKDAK